MTEGQPLTGRHLILGEWVASEGERMAAVNPATGETLEPAFHQAGEAEADRALRAAEEAFEATRDLPAETWAGLLDAIAVKVMALGDRLLETAGAETALPRPRLESERGRTCNQLRLFADLVRQGSWVDAVIDTADTCLLYTSRCV